MYSYLGMYSSCHVVAESGTKSSEISTEGPNTELEKVGRTGDESWRDVGCGAWSELCHGEENWKKVINTWMQPLATWSRCSVDTTVQ